MIKGLAQAGRYVTVSGGNPAPPYISPGSAGAGMLRWNPNMNTMEVNDGVGWKTLDMNYASVGLNEEAESLLDWARQEKDRQRIRQEKIKTNPALKKAYEAILRAEENFEMLDAIVGDYQNEETTGL